MSEPLTDAVTYEVSGSTATITLDSPHNRNAISPALLDGMTDGLHRAEEDPQVRSLVLTHTGNTFCAGADLKSQSQTGETGGHSAAGATQGRSPADALRERGEAGSRVNRALLQSPLPIVAVLHGHVRAGGMGFVASCDFAIAGREATFGLSEVRIGVVPAVIAPPVLARLSDRTAADWLLRGGVADAQQAAAAGFISRAVDGDADAVNTAVGQLLEDLRKGAPEALAAAKALVNGRVLADLDAREAQMLDLSARFFGSPEAQAGMQAFLHKKPAPWVAEQ